MILNQSKARHSEINKGIVWAAQNPCSLATYRQCSRPHSKTWLVANTKLEGWIRGCNKRGKEPEDTHNYQNRSNDSEPRLQQEHETTRSLAKSVRAQKWQKIYPCKNISFLQPIHLSLFSCHIQCSIFAKLGWTETKNP